MLENYLPILVFIALGIAFGLAPMVISWFITPKNPDPAKLSPYECGFDAFEDARMPFDVKFYLIAILFIIFDLETAFLFPWAVVIHDIGWYGFTAMMIFLGLLAIGFIFEWKKGALEWE
jgi:NADH-quinone oxidoreductase subunit A